MLKVVNRKDAKLLAALAAAGLVLSPAYATTAAKKRAAAVSLSFDPISSFTPANADPKLAAAIAGKGLALTDFKFTPAPAKGRPSQVRVAIRSRVNAPAQPARLADAAAVNALTPTTYNLGVALGWKRFAVSGDVSQVKEPNSAIGDREGAVVGVSYSLKRFTGRVAVGAERSEGQPLPVLAHGNSYSVDVGGSYDLSHHIALTGGVRYNIQHDKNTAFQDERRDSQAVYVGTAFKF